jgi:hypothetical protein
MLGAIEAGGTKFVCAVGYEDGTIVESVVFQRLRLRKRCGGYFPSFIITK